MLGSTNALTKDIMMKMTRSLVGCAGGALILSVMLAGCDSSETTAVKPVAARPSPIGKPKKGGAIMDINVYPAPPGVYTGLKGGKKD